MSSPRSDTLPSTCVQVTLHSAAQREKLKAKHGKTHVACEKEGLKGNRFSFSHE